MKLILVRFLILFLLAYPVISKAQQRESPEETLTNEKIDSLLVGAVGAIASLEYNKAIELLTYSRNLAIKIDHKKRISLASGKLATLYLQLNQYNQAKKENEFAILSQKKSNSNELLAQSYITASRIAIIEGDSDRTLKFIEKGLIALEGYENSTIEAQLLTLKADFYRNNNEHIEAIRFYDKAIESANQGRNGFTEAQAQINKSLSLSATGRLEDADKNIFEVEEFIKNKNFPEIERSILLAKNALAQGRGNYKEAIGYLNSYYTSMDGSSIENFISKPLPLQKDNELESIIERLDREVSVEVDRNSRAIRLTLVLTIALCSILALLTLSLYKNNNLRAKANELLQAKNVELVIARDNAEKASMVKAQFLSTITHELRTPMYAVTGLTHLLLSENPTQDQKKHLDSLKFSGEYLLSLINNILDLNKLEANKVEVEETSFNLKKRIEDVIFALSNSSRDKGNKLILDFDEEIPKELVGDPLMISQILINLVGNSIKFTQEGEVKVSVKKISQGESDIRLRFTIKDNGEGISKKKQKTIFQNFTQGSVAINRKFGGTGLGLSIVKNLLDLLNSKITLESTLGKGTTFKFDLKYNLIECQSGDAHSAKEVQYDIDYSSLENRHILVVEDNKINQMITRKILEKNKITCETADNGEIAVEKARTQKYDLILMDIHMPGISGMEATEQIRDFNSDIPILALTAVTIDENIDDFYKVGFNDIIPKPYKIEEFFQKIQNGLKTKKVLN